MNKTTARIHDTKNIIQLLTEKTIEAYHRNDIAWAMARKKELLDMLHQQEVLLEELHIKGKEVASK